MTADLTSLDTLLKLQGDLVAVYRNEHQWLLTFVHVIGTDSRQLRLVNRQHKTRQPDWLVNQKLLDAVKPAVTNKVGAKWEVALR